MDVNEGDVNSKEVAHSNRYSIKRLDSASRENDTKKQRNWFCRAWRGWCVFLSLVILCASLGFLGIFLGSYISDPDIQIATARNYLGFTWISSEEVDERLLSLVSDVSDKEAFYYSTATRNFISKLHPQYQEMATNISVTRSADNPDEIIYRLHFKYDLQLWNPSELEQAWWIGAQAIEYTMPLITVTNSFSNSLLTESWCSETDTIRREEGDTTLRRTTALSGIVNDIHSFLPVNVSEFASTIKSKNSTSNVFMFGDVQFRKTWSSNSDNFLPSNVSQRDVNFSEIERWDVRNRWKRRQQPQQQKQTDSHQGKCQFATPRSPKNFCRFDFGSGTVSCRNQTIGGCSKAIVIPTNISDVFIQNSVVTHNVTSLFNLSTNENGFYDLNPGVTAANVELDIFITAASSNPVVQDMFSSCLLLGGLPLNWLIEEASSSLFFLARWNTTHEKVRVPLQPPCSGIVVQQNFKKSP